MDFLFLLKYSLIFISCGCTIALLLKRLTDVFIEKING